MSLNVFIISEHQYLQTDVKTDVLGCFYVG